MEISDLTNIISNESKNRYCYKKINFLVETRKKNNLIVFFHGARGLAPLPIFRGFDFSFKNANILSFSDPLYQFYNEINIGWYFNTTKYPELRQNIKEIVQYIYSLTQTKNIIFVGQCSGCLIATKLACQFNQHLLITQPHLILKADDINHTFHHFDVPEKQHINNNKISVVDALKKDEHDLINYKDIDCRNYFTEFPKSITIYAHKDDYTVEAILKTNEFLNKNNKSNICNLFLHNTPGVSPHHNAFPPGTKLLNAINQKISQVDS